MALPATSYNVTKKLWDVASKRFASGAIGEAHVFFGPGAPTSISTFVRVEANELVKRGVSIVQHFVE